MRTIVLVIIALAGMSLTSAFADTGTWCCGQYKLRLFLVRGMLGHGAPRRGISKACVYELASIGTLLRHSPQRLNSANSSNSM